LAANLFRGCRHGCVYCYAPQTLKMCRTEFCQPKIRPGVIEQLRKEALRYHGTDKRVLLCFTTDLYQGMGTEFDEVTREALAILHANEIPFTVLTKGGTRACADFDLYGPNDIFATTLTFRNDARSLRTEPNAALPFDRIEAIKAAHSTGIRTEVSLEPVIDEQETYALIAETCEYVDLYKVGKLNYMPSDIDWAKFGKAVIHMFTKLSKSYYIKKDLGAHLEGIAFENTDTRRVQR